MAQLKDTVVSGSLRATDTIYSTTNQFQILKIPTSSNGTTYGPGTNGQILKSNGTSVYWASDNNSDTQVTQAAAITTAGAYPIILANSTATTAVTGTVNKTSTLTYNPNTKSLVTGGTVDGYTLAAASAKAVTDSSSASAIGTGTSLPTERDIYYGLPTINNAHNYTSSTNIYAPTSGGTEGQFLGANGSTSTPTWKDITEPDIAPLETKTYTDIIATGTTVDTAGFFYAKVRPTSFDGLWYTKVKVTATVSSNANYNTITTYEIWGTASTYVSYKNQNSIKSTSYRPIYYNTVFFASSTGYTNNCGHWLGFSLRGSNNSTDTNLKRTVTIELLDYDNCTVELQNSLITSTNIPNRASNTAWYSSTYNSYTELDACNNGLRETGDDNTVNIYSLTPYYGTFNADSALYRYQLLVHVDDDTLSPFNNNSNTTGTTKTILTNISFDPFNYIYYYNSTTTVAANAAITASSLSYAYHNIDLRYTFNITTSTLTAHKDVYMKCILDPNNNNDNNMKFKIAEEMPLTQTIPTTEDGYFYLFLGRTYSGYQMALYPIHPIYWYKDGAFRRYETIPPITRGGTGATSAADARTNLGLGSLATKSSLTTSDIPTISITDKTTGTLTVARGGTGATSFTANSVIISGSTTTAALTTRAIDDATSNTALGTGTGLTTERSVYYGLVTVNNASQTRATGIYAPTSAGTANQLLVSAGGTSAPTWRALVASDIPDISSTYLKLSGGTLTGALGFAHNTMNTVRAESSITDNEDFLTKVYTVQDNDVYTTLGLMPLSNDSIHYATKLTVSDGTDLTVARLYHSGNIIYSNTAPTDADVIGGLAEGMIWLQPV